MDARAFRHLLTQLAELTASQRQRLLRTINAPCGQPPDEALPDLPACPHCHAAATRLRPWGFSRGLQRYRCQTCLRTCTTLTDTSLSRLQYIERWDSMPRP